MPEICLTKASRSIPSLEIKESDFCLDFFQSYLLKHASDSIRWTYELSKIVLQFPFKLTFSSGRQIKKRDVIQRPLNGIKRLKKVD